MQLVRVGWRERDCQGGVTSRGLRMRIGNSERVKIGWRPKPRQKVAPVGLGRCRVGRQMLLQPGNMLPVCSALLEAWLLAAPHRGINVEHLLDNESKTGI